MGTGGMQSAENQVTSGRRLVVVTEEGSGGPSYPWFVNAFELIQDTPYTFDTVDDFTCDLNRGQADAPLLLVNHWLSGFTSIVTAAEQVNAQPVLGARVAQCADEIAQLVRRAQVGHRSRPLVQAAHADRVGGIGDHCAIAKGFVHPDVEQSQYLDLSIDAVLGGQGEQSVQFLIVKAQLARFVARHLDDSVLIEV